MTSELNKRLRMYATRMDRVVDRTAVVEAFLSGERAPCTIIAVPAAVASLRRPPGRLSRARRVSGAIRRAQVWRNVADSGPSGAALACPAAPSPPGGGGGGRWRSVRR